MTDTVELDPPYEDNIVASFGSGYPTGLGRFNFNISETANAGDASTPNVVANCGWNLGPGGDAQVSGLTALGIGFEGHYVPNPGEEYNEFHIYWVDKNGIQGRPLSYRIDKDSGATNCLLHAGAFAFFEDFTQDSNFLTINRAGYGHRFVKSANSAVPDKGIYISGDQNYVFMSRLGPDPMRLNWYGWTSINLGPQMELHVDYATIFFKSSGGTTRGWIGDVSNPGSDFKLALQDGAGFSLTTIGGGGGEAIHVDFPTALTKIKLAVAANDSAAASAGVPVGYLYREAGGTVRARVS